MRRGSLRIVLDRHGVKLWRAQWRENGKGRTRILGRCLDVRRGDARAELDRIVTVVNGKPAPGNPSDTVGQFVESEYLAQRSRQWKGSTAITTESLIKLHVINELGSRPLSSITRKELQALLDRKAAAGLSYSIVAHIRWQLRAIFQMAKNDGLISLEPAESLHVAVTKAVDKRVIALEQIVRAQMALAIKERLIFRLAACEGMRPGEVVALQVGDITDRGISVERRVYCGQVDTPKSYKSRRVIPPTPATRDMLRSYIELIGETRPDV